MSYIKTYSDFETYNTTKSGIRLMSYPPVKFRVNGICSNDLSWDIEWDKPVTHTDYKDDNPVLRITQKAYYTSSDLQIEVTYTEYPDFPVIEYEAYIKNVGKENSGRITDMCAIDRGICDNEYKLHYYTGATFTGKGQYTPYEKEICEGSSLYLEVTDGKSSGAFMPYFNAEGKSGGVVFALGWQGSWKCYFEGANICAGQFSTDLVLLPDEALRFPQVTLMYYKGDEAEGQNLWRRFMQRHVTLRKQGHRMKSNVLICVGDDFEGMRGNAENDLKWIEMLKESGLNKEIDYFNQDAGWYDCEEKGWYATGNWTPNNNRYPKGIRQVSDAAREAEMKYSLWFEPERAQTGTETVSKLSPDGVVAMDASKLTENPTAEEYANNLVYYGNEKALDYISEKLIKVITQEGVDQYRQDFNFYPARYYRAIDLRESLKYGIPRNGIAENKHTTGIFKLWDRLLEAKPDLDIDACASGGMRHDIKTQCYSFTHTVTDYWHNVDEAQCITYTKSKWWPMTGGGAVLDESDDYDLNCRLISSFGIIIRDVDNTKEIIKKWRENAKYFLYDFYPLLPFTREKDGIMAFQYHSPEEGIGSVFIYLREGGEAEIKLRGLDKGRYILDNITDNTRAVITEGDCIKIKSETRKAVVIRYKKEKAND